MFKRKERTIKQEITFGGKALQTGKNVNVRCLPGEEGTGIVFRRVDIAGKPEIFLKEGVLSGEKKRRSAIRSGKAEVETVEHLLAALWALEIDNIVIELDRPELPAMDGSAWGFCKALRKAALEEQAKEREYIVIQEEIELVNGDAKLKAVPSETFSASYYIDYNIKSVNKELFEYNGDKNVFFRDIAPARTFCLKREALFLILLGLGKGANFENTLVLGKNGPVKTEMRFQNEPVRHKMLDLIGDLYLLGRPIIGKFYAHKSGHTLNGEMIKMIYEKYVTQH